MYGTVSGRSWLRVLGSELVQYSTSSGFSKNLKPSGPNVDTQLHERGQGSKSGAGMPIEGP